MVSKQSARDRYVTEITVISCSDDLTASCDLFCSDVGHLRRLCVSFVFLLLDALAQRFARSSTNYVLKLCTPISIILCVYS